MCNRMWRNGIRKPLILRLPCFYEGLESYFELTGYIYSSDIWLYISFPSVLRVIKFG